MQYRSKIVEAMARELIGRVNAPEQEIYRVAGDLTDIALKAAAKILRERIESYVEDHGILDLETGVTEFPGNGEDFVSVWEEIEEEILALTSEGMKP